MGLSHSGIVFIHGSNLISELPSDLIDVVFIVSVKKMLSRDQPLDRLQDHILVAFVVPELHMELEGGELTALVDRARESVVDHLIDGLRW